jgi:hypothetical protein
LVAIVVTASRTPEAAKTRRRQKSADRSVAVRTLELFGFASEVPLVKEAVKSISSTATSFAENVKFRFASGKSGPQPSRSFAEGSAALSAKGVVQKRMPQTLRCVKSVGLTSRPNTFF